MVHPSLKVRGDAIVIHVCAQHFDFGKGWGGGKGEAGSGTMMSKKYPKPIPTLKHGVFRQTSTCGLDFCLEGAAYNSAG